MTKRIISMLITIVMVLGVFAAIPTMAAGMFTDTAGHWAEATIEELAKAGVINGKGYGLYDPQGTVTRAEFMKLLVCALGEHDATAKIGEGTIADVKETDWYYTYVVSGLESGIFHMDSVYDSEFLPTVGMTRGDVAIWMTNGLGIETDGVCTFTDIKDAEVKKAVTTAVAEGLITGYEDNTYRPEKTLTRAEAAVIVKRVMAKQEELTTLRESENKATFANGVAQIEADNVKNVVIKKDEAKMEITFGNCTNELKNLKPGQVFYVEPTASEPAGVLSKVGTINVDGDTVTINCVDLTLKEAFSKIDFAQELPVTMDDYIAGSSDEGVSVSEVKGAYDENGVFVAGMGDETLLAFSLDAKFEKKGSKNLVNVKQEFEEGDLTGYVQVSSTAIVDLLLDPNLFKKSDYRASVMLENNVTASLTYAKDFAYEKSWDLADFSVNFAGPFSVNIDMDLVFTAKGEFEITTTASYQADIGVKYNNGKTSLVKETTRSLSLTANAKGELTVGPNVVVGLGVSVFGQDFDFADVEGNLGIGVSAETAIEHTLTGTLGGELSHEKGEVSGEIYGGVEYTAHNNTPDEEGYIHICDLCFDGDAFVYLSGSVGISKELTDLLETGEIRYEIDEERWSLTKWYCSISDDNGVKFGLGECPYKYGPIKITSQPQGADVTMGAPIVLSVKAGSGKNGTEKAKQMIVYKWYKDGKELANQFDATLAIPSAQVADTGTYQAVAYYSALGDKLIKAESTAVTVNVAAYSNGPEFTTQPQSVTVDEGFAAVLSAFAEPPQGTYAEYQWYKDGSPIGGANSSSYAITSATAADAGTYYCEAWISGYENLKSVSASATVTVEVKSDSAGDSNDDGVLDTDIFGGNNTNSNGPEGPKNNNGGVLDTDIFG